MPVPSSTEQMSERLRSHLATLKREIENARELTSVKVSEAFRIALIEQGRMQPGKAEEYASAYHSWGKQMIDEMEGAIRAAEAAYHVASVAPLRSPERTWNLKLAA